jgi:Flp pilus assembly protein TadD
MIFQVGRGQYRQALLCSAIVLALAGCQSARNSPLHTGSIGSSAVVATSDLTPEDAVAAVQKWGAAYSRDQTDRVVALNYAAALRAAGEKGQAVAVMRKAAIRNPNDREVLAAYGKALAANGQFTEALATVRRAQRADNPDWQLLATEGGILDSLQQHEDARALYRQALILAPGEPQILNNLGLSYVLTNELDAAESALRQAVASPRATLRTRENLALVLRLKGKGSEADQLAGPEEAPAAPALTSGESKPENVWEELAQSG